MGLIDTHSHLHAEDFDQDREQVLDRARSAGVELVFLVGEDAADNERVWEVAGRHAELVPCLGLHPDRYATAELAPVLDQISTHADELVAVGEVGLDYWRAKEDPDRKTQRQLLAGLVGVAREKDLTLNVHSRSAGRHTLEFLKEQGAGRVHMHAFDGRAHFAEAAAQEGVFFSLPPSLLRSSQKQKLARRLPLECLLLESDAPVLGPEAGTRNEPENLARTLEWLAETRGVPSDELAGLLEENTHRAYPRLAAWRGNRGQIRRGLPGWLVLLSVLASLWLTLACSRAEAPRPRDPLGWEELDPLAQSYLRQHPVFEGFLSTVAEDPAKGFSEVLGIVRRDHDTQVASAFDPVLPEWLLSLAEESGGQHRLAAEQLLALVRSGRDSPALQTLRDRDPAGFRRRLMRAFLARVGEDPDTCTPERLVEVLLATRSNWARSEMPVGAVQRFRRPQVDSLARMARVLELIDAAGAPARGQSPSVLWVRPGVDVVHPVLGASTQVLAPEPLLLAGCLILERGADPERLTQLVCHPDFRVAELVEWTAAQLREDRSVPLRLHGPTAGSGGPLALRLEDWRSRGVTVTERSDPLRAGSRQWDLTVPSGWARGMSGLCADPIVDRVEDADRFDLVMCPDVLEALPPAVQDLLLLNLRRLCRSKGLLVTTFDLESGGQQMRAGWRQVAKAGAGPDSSWYGYQTVKKAR